MPVRRRRYDTVMEGVGCDRVTTNFGAALARDGVDGAFRISDDESIAMARRLLEEEGLFVGGSSGMNVAAAVRLAEQLGPGHTIVTVLCDGGSRYIDSIHTAAGTAIGAAPPADGTSGAPRPPPAPATAPAAGTA